MVLIFARPEGQASGFVSRDLEGSRGKGCGKRSAGRGKHFEMLWEGVLPTRGGARGVLQDLRRRVHAGAVRPVRRGGGRQERCARSVVRSRKRLRVEQSPGP